MYGADWLCIFYLIVILGFAVVAFYHDKRAKGQSGRLKATIGKETPLLVMMGAVDYKSSCRLIQPEQTHSRWQHRALLITPTRFEVDDLSIRHLIFSFTLEQLQWVGLPAQYKKGFNQFWLHVEKDSEWYTLQIQAYKYDNRSLLLALRRF